MPELNTKPIHVLTIFDDPQVRELFLHELAAQTNVVPSEYDDASNLLEAYHPKALNCVFIGLTRASDRGIRLLLRLKKKHPDCHVVLLGTGWKLAEVVAAMKFGAQEVIEVSDLPSCIEFSLRQARRSEIECLMRSQRIVPPHLVELLTNEELRIYQALIDNRTTKQIASELRLSIRTIHYRKKMLFQKLAVKTRREALELVRSAAKAARSA